MCCFPSALLGAPEAVGRSVPLRHFRQRRLERRVVLLRNERMRPYATSVCGLKLLVYEALSY